MARSRKGGPSTSKIFKAYFDEHPDWLAGSDNSPIYDAFTTDYPNIELSKAVKAICANVKSTMRKANGTVPNSPNPRGRKAGVRKAVKAAPSVKGVLETLEESIDNNLVAAKMADKSGLEEVIKYLRRARNLVSLKLDEMDTGN